MRRPLKRNRLRLACAKIVFLLVFVIIGGRAFQLQVLQGDWLMRQGQRQHLKEWIVLPKRGALYDRGNEPLALSLESQSVYVRPHRLQNRNETQLALARILNLKPADVEQKLAAKKPFIWLKRQVSPVEAEQIHALHMNGIGMYIEPTRYYPQGGLAGHLLGFVNRDSEGLEGIELQYNDYIRGASGSSVSERDALGRRVLVEGVEGLQVPPGSDVHLTIDSPIQHLAEKELEATIQKYRAKAGVAIVVDPATGEVLALANYPTFDPNKASQQSAELRRNRAVTDSFEPGFLLGLDYKPLCRFGFFEWRRLDVDDSLTARTKMNLVAANNFITQLRRNIHVAALANTAGDLHHCGAAAAGKNQLVTRDQIAR